MFRYHLGKMRYTPGSEDRLGYFMLRKPRMAIWANDELIDDTAIESDEDENDFDSMMRMSQGLDKPNLT